MSYRLRAIEQADAMRENAIHALSNIADVADATALAQVYATLAVSWELAVQRERS